MMNLLNLLAMLTCVLAMIFCLQITAQENRGSNRPEKVKLYEMKPTIQQEISNQIGRELHASIMYMTMASYFGQDSVSLLGFRKFFMDNSNEEKKHADKLVEYLNSRNGNLTKVFVPEVRYAGTSGLDALKDALVLEEKVTNHLMALHQMASENENKDVHLMDALESDFLREQVESIRHLKGLIAKLTKLSATQTADLAEYFFDLELNGKLG